MQHDTLTIVRAHIGVMVERGQTRSSQRFCNTGKKYKHCHSKDLAKYLAKTDQ